MPQSTNKASSVLGGIAGFFGLSTLAGLLVAAMLTPAIAVTGITANSAISIFDALPAYIRIGELAQPSTLYVKRNGEDYPLVSFYDQNRTELKYEDLTEIVKDAAVSAEDRRFYHHNGVDLIGLARAAIMGGSGASTITMQLVRNILKENALEAEDEQAMEEATTAEGAEGYKRKLQEIKYAVALEKEYSKEDILTAYLNIAHFGGMTYGIEAAAQRYFSKPQSELDAGEAATLISMVQYPNRNRIDQYDDLLNGEKNGYYDTKIRRNYVLDWMYTDGHITQEEYEHFTSLPVEPKIQPIPNGCMAAQIAQYFCDFVIQTIQNDLVLSSDPVENSRLLKRGGLQIYTPLDWELQVSAENQLRAHTPASDPRLLLGSSLVSIEVGSFNILSMAQNTFYDATVEAQGSKTHTSVNYSTTRSYGGSTGFQPGSTYKAFVLLAWLNAGNTLGEYLDTREKSHPASDFFGSCAGSGATSAWSPKNLGTWPIEMTVNSVVAGSVNNGFVQMAKKVDLCQIRDIAANLGVKNGYETELAPNPSAILGSNEVSPMSMAVAYAGIANQGYSCDPRAITKIVRPDGSEIVPSQACNQALATGVANAGIVSLQGAMSGYSGNTRDGVPLFGKTGTTDNFIQTWLVGSSSKVATAVWVGNMKGRVRLNNVGLGQIRHTIWRNHMLKVNAKYRGGAFGPADPALTGAAHADVPDLTGLTVAQAEDALLASGFIPSLAVDVFGLNDHTVGTITYQSQEANSSIIKGSLVYFARNNGLGVIVPNVSTTPIGPTSEPNIIAEVQNRFSNAGFTVNDFVVQYEYSETVTAGVVIRTSLVEGHIVNPTQPKVTIYVSLGEEPPPPVDPGP